MALTAIPTLFGSGGAGLTPGGAGAALSLRAILEEHRAAIALLQSGGEGELVLARFATAANDSLSGLAARDGVTPVAGDVALVKDHATGSSKGLYVAAAGAWTRLKDASGADVIKSGMLVAVSEGTVNLDKLFMLTTNGPITVGTTSLTFAEAAANLAVATPSVAGAMSAADKAFLDGCHAAKGTNLTDTATQTIQRSEGAWRKLPVLGQGGTLTLGTVGAAAGEQIEITRTDLSAFTYAIVNGGAGAGTLCTFPVSKLASAVFQFDGTNWELRSIGQLA